MLQLQVYILFLFSHYYHLLLVQLRDTRVSKVMDEGDQWQHLSLTFIVKGKAVTLGDSRQSGKGATNLEADLQCASLVVFSVDPGSEGELCDEDLCCLSKKDWCLCTDHLHRGECLNTPTHYKHQSHITYNINPLLLNTQLHHIYRQYKISIKQSLISTQDLSNSLISTTL